MRAHCLPLPPLRAVAPDQIQDRREQVLTVLLPGREKDDAAARPLDNAARLTLQVLPWWKARRLCQFAPRSCSLLRPVSIRIDYIGIYRLTM